MRVALVSSNFSPHVGGIERFVEILAAGLAERGHEVDVVCCRFAGAPLREDLDGFAVHRIRSSYILDRRLNVPIPVPEPVAMLRLLRERVDGADVVHVQDAIYATSPPALALARRAHVASVLTQHVAFVPQGSRLLDVAQHAAHTTLGRSARLATVVATYNPAVADWMRERWGIRDPRVLPAGVPAAISGDRAELRRSFLLPQDRFVALFVGRDVPKKGLDLFLGAADPEFELVAVTDRPQGDASRGTILPFMGPRRLQELLGCVDAFVLPSESEGFPLSLQEALATGVPIVTTWQPGYDYYLAPQDVVVVERDASAIRAALLRLVGDHALRASLSERSRAAARRSFGVERFVSAYEGAYIEARELVRTGR